ncbi:hypothetical protein GJ496_010021 [Pomphorhynchus laevis]|nr:hypothetical protein GJ496_006638 [Pomphorhynchus laevis]KAI0990095.1 hypothetical protein GJ496_010021 [Pomphorhynchus laevis]
MDENHDIPENRANLTHRNTQVAPNDQNRADGYKCAYNVEKQAPNEKAMKLTDRTREKRIFRRNSQQRRQLRYLKDYL